MDYTFNQTVRISFDIMQEWSKRLYMKMGMTEKDALTVAHVLVTADARSVYSHGCMRTSIFYNRITAGGTSATAQPAIFMSMSEISTRMDIRFSFTDLMFARTALLSGSMRWFFCS